MIVSSVFQGFPGFSQVVFLVLRTKLVIVSSVFQGFPGFSRVFSGCFPGFANKTGDCF